jgi:hypothetical protein
MPDVTVGRRSAPRHAMVLAAEVVELPSGAKLTARTADISRTGCHIDTLNPIPQGSEVRVRITPRRYLRRIGPRRLGELRTGNGDRFCQSGG